MSVLDAPLYQCVCVSTRVYKWYTSGEVSIAREATTAKPPSWDVVTTAIHQRKEMRPLMTQRYARKSFATAVVRRILMACKPRA